MKSVEKIVNGVYEECKIPFELIIFDDEKYSTPIFDKSQECFEKCFDFKFTKCYIKVNVAFSATIDLLKIVLESRLEEIFIRKQNVIISLLNDKEVDNDIMSAIFPNNLKEHYLINIYVKNNIEDVYSYLREGYKNSEVEIFTYKGNLIVIGELEDPMEHIESIKETIDNNFVGKCYISYGQLKKMTDVSKVHKETFSKLKLAVKYRVTESIFESNKLILEGIIDSINEEMKESIYTNFSNKFSQLDHDMVKTIDIFFKCGLNLSDSAKELFIHRNTLIYRLDKIEKYTGYDIKKFDNAVLFNIAFFLFKEKQRK